MRLNLTFNQTINRESDTMYLGAVILALRIINREVCLDI